MAGGLSGPLGMGQHYWPSVYDPRPRQINRRRAFGAHPIPTPRICRLHATNLYVHSVVSEKPLVDTAQHTTIMNPLFEFYNFGIYRASERSIEAK